MDGRINKKDHISNYMEQINITVNSLSYLKNVILSKSLPFGANGSFLKKNIIARTSKDKDIAIQRVPELIKKFKKGIFFVYIRF